MVFVGEVNLLELTMTPPPFTCVSLVPVVQYTRFVRSIRARRFSLASFARPHGALF